ATSAWNTGGSVVHGWRPVLEWVLPLLPRGPPGGTRPFPDISVEGFPAVASGLRGIVRERAETAVPSSAREASSGRWESAAGRGGRRVEGLVVAVPDQGGHVRVGAERRGDEAGARGRQAGLEEAGRQQVGGERHPGRRAGAQAFHGLLQSGRAGGDEGG